MHSIATWGLWVVFTLTVTLALIVDFLVLRVEGAHRVALREALWWSFCWVALALVFNAGLWFWLDASAGRAVANEAGLAFFTGYLLEKALAVDNIFVFLLIFDAFAVPAEQRQRALMLGILGALLLRGVMIFIGAALIARFHWILYLFGLFLVYTGGHMLFGAGAPPDIGESRALAWMRRWLHLSERFHGGALSVAVDGRRAFTPLFVVLVLIAISDVIFAVDSIPAIFAVTEDPFLVLSSNVFAVLGLRALFFVLAGVVERFRLLGYGLALVLIFIGVKMLLADLWPVPTGIALAVVALLIGGSMIASLRQPPPGPPPG